MIIDTSCYPTNLVDLAWRHDGEPFSGERLIEVMDGPYIINGKPRRIDQCLHSAAARQHDLYVDRWRAFGPRVDRRLHGLHRRDDAEISRPAARLLRL